MDVRVALGVGELEVMNQEGQESTVSRRKQGNI